MNRKKGNIVIVSNRLPVRIAVSGKKVKLISGSGGLVTALAPVLRDRGGVWIGWDGHIGNRSHPELFKKKSVEIGYSLRSLALTNDEVKRYYEGFSNATLWPLFHDFLDRCQFNPDDWDIYCEVNKKFAKAIAENSTKDDLIWVHDYHLLLVGRFLAELGVKRKLAFFNHIPFPSWDLFMRLPWRKEILEGILHYDLAGFQTERDRWNFVRCGRRIFSGMTINGPQRNQVIEYDGRATRVGSFPISIDYESFNRLACSSEVADEAWYLHERLADRKLVLGVDRLDYTKGIFERLRAFEVLLEKYPSLHEKINLIQIVVPSRTSVNEYKEMKRRIDEMVGRINGRFTFHDWVPIHYFYRSLNRAELVAFYRTCEIALITPLKDGMNLVAKEYCASNIETNGVLILSEFAGASQQLGKSSLLVNPFNVEEVADQIYRAYTMEEKERKKRMGKLRVGIQRNTIFKWVEQFLSTFGMPLPKARKTSTKTTSQQPFP